MEKFPFVSIIIPTYKHWDVLQNCLDALMKQTYGLDLFEVIIINNDSDLPGAPRGLKLTENMRVVHEATPGSYAARNKGVSEAKGVIVGFTDSDCIPNEGWIQSAVSVFRANIAEERVTGPVSVFRSGASSWLVWKYESIVAFNQAYNVKKGLSVTANLFVKKEIFTRVGMFNAELFSGGDIEWNQRATELGVKLVLSKSVIVNHPARRTLKSLLVKSKRVTGGQWQKIDGGWKHKMLFMLNYLIPPVRFFHKLINDNRSLISSVFGSLFYFAIKLLMIMEVVRLIFGGKPVR